MAAVTSVVAAFIQRLTGNFTGCPAPFSILHNFLSYSHVWRLGPVDKEQASQWIHGILDDSLRATQF